MKVFIKIKAISKRKPIIDSMSFNIKERIETSNQLIEYIVRKNIKEYNLKDIDKDIFNYLTDEQINNQEISGRFSFNDRRNENKQDENKGVENALQCFEDGIFCMLINNQEIGYNKEINLKENDEIVFIRLVMLTGRLW